MIYLTSPVGTERTLWLSMLRKHSFFIYLLALIFQKTIPSCSTLMHNLILILLSTLWMLLSPLISLRDIILGLPLLLRRPQRSWVCYTDSVKISPICSFCRSTGSHLPLYGVWLSCVVWFTFHHTPGQEFPI